jgi:hypothetical protein
VNSWLKHPLRLTGRLFRLGGELILAAINHAVHCAFCSRDALPGVGFIPHLPGDNLGIAVKRAPRASSGSPAGQISNEGGFISAPRC